MLYNIIQIWTCDHGNLDFYGSEATNIDQGKAEVNIIAKDA